MSDELLSSLDADLLILGRSAAASDEELNALTSGALFQNLGAVRSGHLVQLPPKTQDGGDLLWALNNGGPIGATWAAQELVPLLTAVL